jgi:protein SCO1/2
MNNKWLLAVIVLIYMPFEGYCIQEPVEVGIVEKLGETIPLDLTFKDSQGNGVVLKDVIKKPTILSLVYFHCPTVCKPLLGAKVNVINRLGMTPGKDYQLLTISFNEDETPKHAKTIKDHFIARSKMDIPQESWLFLTGDKESIAKLTGTLGYRFKRDGEDFLHPVGIMLLSPKGKITRYLYGMSYLPFDLKLGIIEAAAGKIGPTINKVLLYCFKYDPEGQTYVFNILKVTATITLFFLLLFVAWLVISTRRRKKRTIE